MAGEGRDAASRAADEVARVIEVVIKNVESNWYTLIQYAEAVEKAIRRARVAKIIEIFNIVFFFVALAVGFGAATVLTAVTQVVARLLQSILGMAAAAAEFLGGVAVTVWLFIFPPTIVNLVAHAARGLSVQFDPTTIVTDALSGLFGGLGLRGLTGEAATEVGRGVRPGTVSPLAEGRPPVIPDSVVTPLRGGLGSIEKLPPPPEIRPSTLGSDRVRNIGGLPPVGDGVAASPIAGAREPRTPAFERTDLSVGASSSPRVALPASDMAAPPGSGRSITAEPTSGRNIVLLANLIASPSPRRLLRRRPGRPLRPCGSTSAGVAGWRHGGDGPTAFSTSRAAVAQPSAPRRGRRRSGSHLIGSGLEDCRRSGTQRPTTPPGTEARPPSARVEQAVAQTAPTARPPSERVALGSARRLERSPEGQAPSTHLSPRARMGPSRRGAPVVPRRHRCRGAIEQPAGDALVVGVCAGR
jgi:hypothetical protein